MVSDVSATLVDRISLRLPPAPARAHALLVGGQRRVGATTSSAGSSAGSAAAARAPRAAVAPSAPVRKTKMSSRGRAPRVEAEPTSSAASTLPPAATPEFGDAW